MNEKTNAAHSNALLDLLKEALLKRLPKQARLTATLGGLAIVRRDLTTQPVNCLYPHEAVLPLRGC